MKFFEQILKWWKKPIVVREEPKKPELFLKGGEVHVNPGTGLELARLNRRLKRARISLKKHTGRPREEEFTRIVKRLETIIDLKEGRI